MKRLVPLTAALAAAISLNAVVPLDSFTAPPGAGQSVIALGATVVPAAGAPAGPGVAGVLGGHRIIALSHSSGGGLTSLSVNSDDFGTAGVLSYSSPTPWAGTASVIWSGDLDGTGSLALDMTGTPIVQFDVLSADNVGVDPTVTVWSGVSSFPVSIPTVSGGGPFTVDFDMSGAAFLNNVTKITLDMVSAGVGADVVIDEARLVPEPHEYALLAGLGLLGLAAYRRIKA